jgi:hypothetical protein
MMAWAGAAVASAVAAAAAAVTTSIRLRLANMERTPFTLSGRDRLVQARPAGGRAWWPQRISRVAKNTIHLMAQTYETPGQGHITRADEYAQQQTYARRFACQRWARESCRAELPWRDPVVVRAVAVDHEQPVCRAGVVARGEFLPVWTMMRPSRDAPGSWASPNKATELEDRSLLAGAQVAERPAEVLDACVNERDVSACVRARGAAGRDAAAAWAPVG